MNRQDEKTLYLECCSGISGDMIVAALLDLGADERILLQALDSIPVEGFQIKISRVKKAGLDACDFAVVLNDAYENHDHDMDYLHGHMHEHTHEHGHLHTGEHVHRGLDDILHIIEHTEMTDGARKTAVRIFKILADAEAKAHGVPLKEVHFHEVGAVDSIVDIIAAAVCLDNLRIRQCIVPVLHEGTGTVRCQHGILPVPVPAVANIAEAHHLKLHITDINGEFVTPTGAAIAAALRTSDKLPETFTIQKTGLGAGKRTYERPSLLRAMLIEEQKTEKDVIWKLESNIDDCSGEVFGYTMERLFDAGARDVHYVPVYMKKNRPGWQVNVICTEDKIEELEQILFEETTTIGIRRQKMERSVLKRGTETVHTSLGEAQVKVCTLKSGIRKYPEYESVAALCRKHGKPFQEVFRIIEKECESGE